MYNGNNGYNCFDPFVIRHVTNQQLHNKIPRDAQTTLPENGPCPTPTDLGNVDPPKKELTQPSPRSATPSKQASKQVNQYTQTPPPFQSPVPQHPTEYDQLNPPSFSTPHPSPPPAPHPPSPRPPSPSPPPPFAPHTAAPLPLLPLPRSPYSQPWAGCPGSASACRSSRACSRRSPFSAAGSASAGP